MSHPFQHLLRIITVIHVYFLHAILSSYGHSSFIGMPPATAGRHLRLKASMQVHVPACSSPAQSLAWFPTLVSSITFKLNVE